MFCLNGLIDYSRRYEKQEPDMTIEASFGKRHLGKVQFRDWKDPAKEMKADIGKDDPGKKAKVVLQKSGKGRYYYSVKVRYAPKAEFSKRINSGMDIRKEYPLNVMTNGSS